jgi:hypothetical protein
MRIPVNLASEPFRKDRPMIAASLALSGVLLLLLGAQLFLIFNERGRAAENRESVGKLNAQLVAMRDEQARLDATLREPMNAEVLQRSLLLNSLIQRKGISWAQLMSDIESVLPNRVRVIQVRLPQITARNQVTLDLEVGAESATNAIEFVRRLESSELFGPVSISRNDPPTQNEPVFRLRLTVSYGQKL